MDGDRRFRETFGRVRGTVGRPRHNVLANHIALAYFPVCPCPDGVGSFSFEYTGEGLLIAKQALHEAVPV